MTVDVVVFAAPQLSLLEMQALAGLLDGRQRVCRCWWSPARR